jgi:hypothetical protein
MWEEIVIRIAAAAFFVFNVVFWLLLLTVAGLFVVSLICETIESIRGHSRRAVRLRAQVPPPPSISEGWVVTGLVRRLRHR